MDGTGTLPPLLAQKTCVQCKSSKKKCDKLLPACSRCLRYCTHRSPSAESDIPQPLTTDCRLSLGCSYPERDRQDESDVNYHRNDSRFDEVFRRLNTIEAHVFSRGEGHRRTPAQEKSPATLSEPEGARNPLSLAVNPETLEPQYLGLVLWASVVRALDEHETNIAATAQQYFASTHKWLPIITQAKFERERLKHFDNFHISQSSDKFLLIVFAMHLVVTPISQHPQAESITQSIWYRTCKYHFAQHVALSHPSLELIQAGMLIALFEHVQCVEQRALTTLGICVRLAYDLELDEVVARQSSRGPGEMVLEEEEIVLTWWGLSRLER